MAFDASVRVHPGAFIEDGAQIGANCHIGAFAVIGPEVVLHAGVEVKAHAVVTGCTEIGAGSVVYPFACVGEEPQDLSHSGERTRLKIGARCCIREGATLNTGSSNGGGITRVGDDCMFMTGAHVGHDAQLGDRVVMANQAAVAGHCMIGDEVIIGGLAGIHQHVRVGRGAIIGAVTMVTQDVMPYGLVQAPRGALEGLNLIGLKRRGLPRDELTALRAAYQMLAQGDGSFIDRARRLADESESPYVREITAFILAGSERSFLTPR